jgi:hypothetical protein
MSKSLKYCIKREKPSILSVLSGAPMFFWGADEGCIEGCGLMENHKLFLSDFLGRHWPVSSQRMAISSIARKLFYETDQLSGYTKRKCIACLYRSCIAKGYHKLYLICFNHVKIVRKPL